MSSNLPPGLTDANIDRARAAPGYWDQSDFPRWAWDDKYIDEPSHASAMALLSLMCVARDLAKCELSDFDRRIIRDAIKDLTELVK